MCKLSGSESLSSKSADYPDRFTGELYTFKKDECNNSSHFLHSTYVVQATNVHYRASPAALAAPPLLGWVDWLLDHRKSGQCN